MNKRLHLTVGIKKGVYSVLYLGESKAAARDAFNGNRRNKDFDFVGSQVIPGFRSRARPLILEAEEAQRAERAIKEQTDAATLEARQAKAAKKALAEAALEAEARADEAAAKLKELKAAHPKKRGRKPKKDKGADAGDADKKPVEEPDKGTDEGNDGAEGDLDDDLDEDGKANPEDGDGDGADLEGTEDPEDDGLADLVK